MQLDLEMLAAFVERAEYVDKGDGPWEGRISPPPPAIREMLDRFAQMGRDDHLPLLAEYGLKHQLLNLQRTGMGRDLDVEKNPMLSELVRLLKLPQFHSAHEAGWLDSQFYGPFEGFGWSSYQIYVEFRERGASLFENSHRAAAIESLMEQIRTSGRADVGGFGVCHYACK